MIIFISKQIRLINSPPDRPRSDGQKHSIHKHAQTGRSDQKIKT